MLSGVCHLLNGCLGETFIKAVFCTIVTFRLRCFFPGQVSVISVCCLSASALYVSLGFSVRLSETSATFFSAVQLQGLALYRNVCTVVVQAGT